MALVLPLFQKSDPGRFDVRFTDGLGNYIWPDWDSSLKFEFRDSGGTLRFTATTSSSPALQQLTDDIGKYVTIEDLDLSAYDIGIVEVQVYAKYSGAEIAPYPTIWSSAFEIVTDLGTDPLYTTIGRVKNMLPSNHQEVLTDEQITTFIADESRLIDARLTEIYEVPFAAIGDSPATPSLIEQITRYLTVSDCLVHLALENADEPGTYYERANELLEQIAEGKMRPAVLLLTRVRAGELEREDEVTQYDYMYTQ